LEKGRLMKVIRDTLRMFAMCWFPSVSLSSSALDTQRACTRRTHLARMV
jgi:hypothetical protein